MWQQGLGREWLLFSTGHDSVSFIFFTGYTDFNNKKIKKREALQTISVGASNALDLQWKLYFRFDINSIKGGGHL